MRLYSCFPFQRYSMRNLIFGKVTQQRFNFFAKYLCQIPTRSCRMATYVKEPDNVATCATDASTNNLDENEANNEESNKLTSTKRTLNDYEDFKAKRKKMEEVDGKLMQSRKELGLPFRKKKMAMMMMFCGKNYYGMQIQREDQKSKFETIESDLFKALAKSGVILEEHAEDQKAVKFQRAARTDKGVSAAGQIENPTEKINAHLPPQIRILGIRRATKGFDSKNDCDHRTYSYLLPTFALCPVEEMVVETFRIKEETLKRANEVLALYRGTHNFHNYTSGKKPSDPSAKRYIIEMQIGKPFVQDDLEFASITVKGQSFMLHQIRKMIGLMIAVVRGLTDISAIQNSWRPVRTDVPKAPGSGLMLEQVHYDAYNKRYSKTHEKIDCSEYKEEVEKFKRENIYSIMVETEKTEKSMMNWLQTLHLHHFGEVVNPDFPITSETAIGHAVRNVAKLSKETKGNESKSTDTGSTSIVEPGVPSHGSEESKQQSQQDANEGISPGGAKKSSSTIELEDSSQTIDDKSKSETSVSTG